MRKQTLALVSALVAYAIVFAASFAGLSLPLGLSPLFAGLFLTPVLAVLLTPVNKRLLAWRKGRGRDIEEEERHEDEGSGIISLRPRD